MIKSYRSHSGGMAEWLKAPVLKTGLVKANVGSNPSPSAALLVAADGENGWQES